MYRKNKDISAYMTVEISLLFPLFLMMLMCIIYIAFYSYNRTIAFQNSAICAMYGKSFTYTEMEKTELVDGMYTVLEMLNLGQYVAHDYHKQEILVEGNNIVVKQEGNVKIPLLSEKIMSQMNFRESVSVSKQKVIVYIRGIKKVKNYD